ncbi:MAG: Na+/H+ antiporter NhaC [Bacteroidales bacterium]|nr:Na+/H+ antiporter NhaC [Bacteroidales bacterium]
MAIFKKEEKEQKQPTLFQSFIPIIVLIGLLSLNVAFFGDATLDGSNQIALLIAAAVASVISINLGVNWTKIRLRIVKTIGSAMPSILILLMIGALAGAWLISGVVPALIFYGLKVLHPSIFLFAAVVVSGLVSLATGSSWSTIATIGVALLGIGAAMGVSKPMIAGAIISGAYFGDKMSPLSDTTNLAPAMAGTDLFTHIRYMIITTGPTMIITLIIFLIIGFTQKTSGTAADTEAVQLAIKNTFNLNPLLFLVPIILIVIIIKKVPPLPSLFIGTLLGVVFAVIFQPDLVKQIAGGDFSYAHSSYLSGFKAMYGDISVSTGDAVVDELFHTSGMSGMLLTIWLILSAMTFGGVMESSGLLMRITDEIVKFAKSTGSLVASTAVSCIFFNVTASDQYISIVVPGKMYAKTFKKMDLKPEVLSRTLEDAGTVTSVLVPWNTGGATQARVLGVPTLEYLPFAFFNYISPLMSILVAYLNVKIRRISDDKK